jgi:hypothetical protein
MTKQMAENFQSKTLVVTDTKPQGRASRETDKNV